MLFVTNCYIFFTSNLEYTDGSWFHPPSQFMEWAPVFLISTASFAPLAVQSVSSRECHTFPMYGVVRLCYMVRNGQGVQFLDLVYFFSSIDLTSLLCSFALPHTFSLSPLCRCIDNPCIGLVHGIQVLLEYAFAFASS